MFNICSMTFRELDFPINYEKSHCMRIGSRWKAKCCIIWLDGHPLSWVSDINYLGISIRSNTIFISVHPEAKQNFYKSANAIHCLGSNPSINAALSLITKIFVPMLSYGLGALSLNGTELQHLLFAYNSVSCKLFKVNKYSDIRSVQYFSSILEAKHLFNYRRICFLKKLFNNAKLLPNCPLDGPDLAELFNLLSVYNITLCDSKSAIMWKIWEKIKSSLIDDGILP